MVVSYILGTEQSLLNMRLTLDLVMHFPCHCPTELTGCFLEPIMEQTDLNFLKCVQLILLPQVLGPQSQLMLLEERISGLIQFWLAHFRRDQPKLHTNYER